MAASAETWNSCGPDAPDHCTLMTNGGSNRGVRAHGMAASVDRELNKSTPSRHKPSRFSRSGDAVRRLAHDDIESPHDFWNLKSRRMCTRTPFSPPPPHPPAQDPLHPSPAPPIPHQSGRHAPPSRIRCPIRCLTRCLTRDARFSIAYQNPYPKEQATEQAQAQGSIRI